MTSFSVDGVAVAFGLKMKDRAAQRQNLGGEFIQSQNALALAAFHIVPSRPARVY